MEKFFNQNNENKDFPEKYIITCPNCWELTYNIQDNTCSKCWIWKVSSYTFEKNNEHISKINKKTNDITKKIWNLLKEKRCNLKVKYWDYESYWIFVSNWKINSIYFKFKWRKFRILIENYQLSEKFIKEISYYEPEREERNKEFHIIQINNLKLFNGIQEKAKVWYKEKKHINYYNFLGLAYQDLLNFTRKVIKKYHKI